MAKIKRNADIKPVSVILGKRTNQKQQAPFSAPTSKLNTIITLLKRPKGATLEEMMEATGWQRHSVHGTLSGALKKRRGLPVIAECGDKGRTYRIAGVAR